MVAPWLVLLAFGIVAPQSQIAADMLLRRASPNGKIPAPSRHRNFTASQPISRRFGAVPMSKNKSLLKIYYFITGSGFF
jgi:hypothetical protein